MRTSRQHVIGMLWKVSVLWERKNPVCRAVEYDDDDDENLLLDLEGFSKYVTLFCKYLHLCSMN